MLINCEAILEAEGDELSASEVSGWIAAVPDGAHLTCLHHGNRLTGIKATWAEQR